ncbi:alpha-glucosidase [Histoplasma capsulatum var. duboisii H88]|uniref:alpha-glucosidase n=1 Tax=Ajellomyces capsulatus (strain H88) TaxID=544711 RepID=F0UP82_AJEC8|nr:alpha-glucosidase [Histoplasma capsulatum var. duboisii H88]QSS53893.1 alpha-glucosidase [Histoplasma capsulatum var. duboisii H88]
MAHSSIAHWWTNILLVSLAINGYHPLPVSASASNTSDSDKPVFTIPANADRGALLLPNIKDPKSVNAQDVCPGYLASDVKEITHGFSATLSLFGKSCNVYGTDVDKLNLTVEYSSKDRLNVNIVPTHISSSNRSHYILPDHLVPRPKPAAHSDLRSGETDLHFSWSNEPSFSFKVTRRSTGDVLFDTTGTVLVFENQFIEFVSSLPAGYNLYGLGERIHGLRLGNNFTATIYAADVGDPIDTNLYGSHPFYLDTRYFEVQNNKRLVPVADNEHDYSRKYVSYSHGVFLRNAHGHEVLLQPDSLTWRTLGGSIDLYFYSGPSQSEVTKSFQLSTIGLPALQQYYTFGFHQCRWGYKSWTELEDVVSNFEKFGIPLEAIWSDIDFMKGYRDFEFHPENYPIPQGQKFVSTLHQKGLHWIPIVDAAIYIPNPENCSDAYKPYERGNASDVFLRNPDGSVYIGAVWPGYTVFPDFLAAGSQEWWSTELREFFNKVPYDGMWIDMNEVSSFCVGSCGSGNLTLNPVHPPFQLPGEHGNVIYDYPEGFNITNVTEAASASSASFRQQVLKTAGIAAPTTTTTLDYLRTTPTPGVRDVNHPPYVINHVQGDLAVHAVSPNATHADGTMEYEIHNLYGHQLLNATYHGLLQVFPNKRPFIIGRSTFSGSGKWAGHWGGDNQSRWAHMFFSIPQALSFSLFGIPMFGVDTCGFNGNSDEELCNRWMQLSAFFPFYRNHNVLSAISQEPYVWSSVIKATKSAMAIRYALLPYIYTLFHQAHTTGSTVMRALAWEFPNDPSLASVDRQFLLGPSLMIIPVLESRATTVNGVFPGVADGEIWYDWYTRTQFKAVAGKHTTIDAPLGHIPLYVRGGSVFPMQEPALTTRAARNSPWSLLIALDSKSRARGQIYIDDGESVEPTSTLSVHLNVEKRSINAVSTGTYQDTNYLDNITILGMTFGSPGCRVRFNGKEVPDKHVAYNNTSRVLAVTKLKELMNGRYAWSEAWVLEW